MTSYWCSGVMVHFGSISCRFWDIQCRRISRTWNPSRANQGHWKWYHSTDWV